jgi:hypothetical protein
VQVHIYERWLARGAGDDVLVPNFFEESTRHAYVSLSTIRLCSSFCLETAGYSAHHFAGPRSIAGIRSWPP